MFRFTALSSLFALMTACCMASGSAPLTPAQVTQAAKLLASENPAERAVAMRGFRSQGDAVREAYQPLLEKAEIVHKDRLKARIGAMLPVLQKFAESHKEWVAAKEACLGVLFEKTDHEARKLAELAKSYTVAEKAMKDLSRHLKSPPAGLLNWESLATPVNEMEGELAWCRDAPEVDQDYFRTFPARDRAKEVPGGPAFLELAPPYRECLETQAALERATLFNEKEIRWPAPVLKTFMGLINARRYVLGQQVLRLDERLSNCAHGHSREMQELKYFAHESPVEKNKTPWDRARNAQFEGNCTGENIYMGSTAAEAAFLAWWESDGHRFIMFQKDANTLGLGLAANYWTLNTGHRTWPETKPGTTSKPGAAAVK